MSIKKIVESLLLLTIVCFGSLMMILLSLKWKLVYIAAIGLLALVLGSRNKNDVLFALLLVTLCFRIDKKFLFFPYMGGSIGLRIGFEDVLIISIFMVNLWNPDFSFFRRARRLSRIVVPWCILLAVSLLSNVNSGVPLSGIGLMMDMIRCFLLFILAANYFTNEKRISNAIVLLAITVIIQGAITIYQYKTSSLIPGLRYLGQHDDLYQESWLPEEHIRAGGTRGGPNDLAGYMVLILPVVMAMIVQKKGAARGLMAASVLLGITSMIFTFSRSGWGCIVIAFTIFGIMFLSREGTKGKIAPAIVLVCFVFLGIFHYFPLIKMRLSSGDYGSSLSRIPLMVNSINAIMDNPFLGVGINNYSASIAKYDTTGVYKESSYRGGEYPVHNILLLHFAELGIAGGLVFCWLWIACLREVACSAFGGNRLWSIVAMGGLSGMLGQFVFYQVHWGYFESYLPFWVVLALCVGWKNHLDVAVEHRFG